MLKRAFQLPVLLLQVDGCPELLYNIEETELAYKIFMYLIFIMYCTISYFLYFFWGYIDVPRIHQRARVPPTI
jgi:hypothetical protein